MRTFLQAMLVASIALTVVRCSPSKDGSGQPITTAPSDVLAGKVTIPKLSGTVVDSDGEPIAGATVRAWGYSTRTGGDGRFELSMQLIPGSAIPLSVSCDVCLWDAARSIPAAAVNTRVQIEVVRLYALPMDGEITALLRPSDPQSEFETWNDYARHTRFYRFTTPVDNDVSVELSWEHAGNADLKMWVQQIVISEPAHGRQYLTLRRGTSSILSVVQPVEAGELAQPVTFTLNVRTIR